MMRRGIAFAVVGVLLVLLLSIIAQLWLLPAEIRSVAATFPEVERLAAPAIIWGAVAIACWQAIALIGLRLAAPLRRGEFGPAWYGWLRGMLGCLMAFLALVVAALIALNVMGYATPGVMLGLLGSGIIAAVGAGSLALFLESRPQAHFRHA
ncbi:DUF2975 domain-containing protein [Arthrobacter sp. A2-55]|uniref:DUF2975 domain-containing protein n=1 Tax=Arthrobacter sp. A2-55 TaxID=2897337 RepID=UPI0021CD60D5|nr:DUF2975 domain-containing protein [Arthrobacter sp. A2-55]MCU6480109.1 DUF2975 domain-containing protein [Arthrobacter sp. A2-55]